MRVLGFKFGSIKIYFEKKLNSFFFNYFLIQPKMFASKKLDESMVE